jgi:hypothetical protein
VLQQYGNCLSDAMHTRSFSVFVAVNEKGQAGEVAKRSIELEFNGRFTDTWTDVHTF